MGSQCGYVANKIRKEFWLPGALVDSVSSVRLSALFILALIKTYVGYLFKQ